MRAHQGAAIVAATLCGALAPLAAPRAQEGQVPVCPSPEKAQQAAQGRGAALPEGLPPRPRHAGGHPGRAGLRRGLRHRRPGRRGHHRGRGDDDAVVDRLREPAHPVAATADTRSGGARTVARARRGPGVPALSRRSANHLHLRSLSRAYQGRQRMAETRSSSRWRSASGRVLLVDDEPRTRDAMREALDGAGFAVAAAPGADGALGAVRTRSAPPPAVLVAALDAAARGVPDGFAVAAEARRRWPGVGVVYVTGRRPSRLDGRVLGPRDLFLLKPVAPTALVRAVSGLARPPTITRSLTMGATLR
jgi:CheY-like chemotaxis protein